MKTLSLTLLLSLLMLPVASADIVYSENFDSQDGKGAVALNPGLSTDTTGVDWSLDVSSTFLATNSAGHFQVQPSFVPGAPSSDKAFEASNLDGPAIWRSPSLDITGLTGLSLSLDVAELGEQAPAYYVDIRFLVDGTETRVGEGNSGGYGGKGNMVHTLNDDFGLANVVDILIPDGDDLQISVTIRNDATNRFFLFDNVQVMGTVAAVPEPTAFLFGSLLTGVAGLAVGRRHRA